MLGYWLMACAPLPTEVVPVSSDDVPGSSGGDADLYGEAEEALDTGDENTDASLLDLPVVFVHGITGEGANWEVVIDDLVANGWDPDLLFAETFEDPEWGCNVDNAATIDRWVDAVLRATGASQVQLVAHSMGTLSSRYYLKHHAEEGVVHNYITLGGMHHGLQSSCSPDFPFKPCTWDEICTTGPFVEALNAAPTTPNAAHYVSIYGTGDETVPNWSSQLTGAFEIELQGLEHFGPNGVIEHPDALDEIRRALLWR